jgi:chromate transport protein ChrA
LQFHFRVNRSQTVFAIGMRRAGVLGAFTVSLGFTLPLIRFAFGVAWPWLV